MGYTRKFDLLLHEICVGLGFCGGDADGKPVHVTDFIPDAGTVTADQFVEFVLRGDGIDPATHTFSRNLIGQIRQAFVELMGSEEVDATEFRWS